MTPAPHLILEVGRRLPQRDLKLAWRVTFSVAIDIASTLSLPTQAVHDLFLTRPPTSGVLRPITVQLSVCTLTNAYSCNALDGGASG